jgi:hypothetical protein
MVGSFVNTFTGGVVKPSFPSYQAIALSAATSLYWPTETLEGVPYVATQIDVTPSGSSLSLAMPNALAGSLGPACLISNLGTQSFTLVDFGGNTIISIGTTTTWQITLTSNATSTGTWRTVQIGSTTSVAQASVLADNQTITATTSNTLQTNENVNVYTTSTTLYAANRGTLNVLAVGSGLTVFTLDLIANLTSGWWCEILNLSFNALTIASTSGQTINGSATIAAGGAGKILCTSSGFYIFDNVSATANTSITLALVQAQALAL